MFRRSERTASSGPMPDVTRSSMSRGKLAYEARRAAEAGMTLEAWLSKKARDAARAAAETLRTNKVSPKPKGLIGRLLDRAHKPLG